MGVVVELWEGLAVTEDVADGDSVGDGVVVDDWLGVGDAKATHSPGQHAMSTAAGQLAPVQFHTPYSVLPTHDPSPEHERLHRPGMDGRVQNMMVLVHE